MSEQTQLEKLHAALIKFNALEGMEAYTNTYVAAYGAESEHYPEEADDLLVEIDGLAEAALITSEGRPNIPAINILEDAGFKVRPGEQDSFGWLTGVIHTANGKIVFG